MNNSVTLKTTCTSSQSLDKSLVETTEASCKSAWPWEKEQQGGGIVTYFSDQ